MTVEQIFITLLRNGLSGQDCKLIEYGILKKCSWQKVYSLAKQQGLLGIVFSGIERLPKNQLPNMDLLMDWLGQVEYIASCNEQYRTEVKEFTWKLTEYGLKVSIMKGMECAKYYPQPDRRSLGDLDIFPIIGSYSDVNEACKAMGLSVDFHDYKHSKIRYKNLTVENHKFCTEIRGERLKRDFERRLQDLLILDNKVQFNALFLIAHAFNHFLDEGLSLRQICDWAMFVKAEQDYIDWEEFYEWMGKMYMRKFADALNAIAIYDLGIFVHNNAIITQSKYKDKILYDALYGHKHLHSRGLHGINYRIEQLKITISDRWKYSEICGQNAISEYLKGVWYYFTQKNPHI